LEICVESAADIATPSRDADGQLHKLQNEPLVSFSARLPSDDVVGNFV
jgi:hypothetical protein